MKETFDFGWNRKLLSKQAKDKGYTIEKPLCDNFEKDIDAIIRLKIRQFITEKEHQTIVKRLAKEISSNLIKIKK